MRALKPSTLGICGGASSATALAKHAEQLDQEEAEQAKQNPAH